MSILARSENGWIISHEKFFERIEVLNYQCESETEMSNSSRANSAGVKILKLNPNLFEINDPFVPVSTAKSKNKAKNTNAHEPLSSTSVNVKALSQELVELVQKLKLFDRDSCIVKDSQEFSSNEQDGKNPSDDHDHNTVRQNYLAKKPNRIARETASEFFDCVKDVNIHENNISGENPDESYAVISKVLDHDFVFLKNTKFHCRDVNDLEQQLNGEKFDLIVMDPPWWNKYIRRRKRKQAEAGYQLLENLRIEQLPIDTICEDNALVVVWCTNSKTHQKELIEDIFPKWELEYLTTWYWLKITKSGIPVCPFNAENKKQPYEAIIIGRRTQQPSYANFQFHSPIPIPTPKIILSVPSSINSHKPPLIDVISDYFKLTVDSERKTKQLEIFARYLIPGFTSVGNEAIKLQHNSLYLPVDSNVESKNEKSD